LKKEILLNLLEKKHPIQQLETAELKSIVAEFPYFQTARALYLKGLKNVDSFKYNNELKVTAAYTSNRTILFDYITALDFKEKKKENIQVQTPEEVFIENAKDSLIGVQVIEKKLAIGKPLSFSSEEGYSFNQWLQLSGQKPIVRTEDTSAEKPVEKQTKKEAIIDAFIRNNPKIKPVSKDKKTIISVAKNKQDKAIMTETLAKVYLEQKKYENAMQAYRILSLKYPEKSGFFADQIKRVQILQKNKS
jgi:hypothetical protein